MGQPRVLSFCSTVSLTLQTLGEYFFHSFSLELLSFSSTPAILFFFSTPFLYLKKIYFYFYHPCTTSFLDKVECRYLGLTQKRQSVRSQDIKVTSKTINFFFWSNLLLCRVVNYPDRSLAFLLAEAVSLLSFAYLSLSKNDLKQNFHPFWGIVFDLVHQDELCRAMMCFWVIREGTSTAAST
jgi:hypothetical protein